MVPLGHQQPKVVPLGHPWLCHHSEIGESFFTPRTEGEMLASPNLMAFSFSDLKAATKNFRLDNLIGEGGFNYVYKGCIDEQPLAPSKPGYMVWLLRSRS
jgi:hypothetical protein